MASQPSQEVLGQGPSSCLVHLSWESFLQDSLKQHWLTLHLSVEARNWQTSMNQWNQFHGVSLPNSIASLFAVLCAPLCYELMDLILSYVSLVCWEYIIPSIWTFPLWHMPIWMGYPVGRGRFWNLLELELVHWELVHRGVKPTLVVTVHFYIVNLFTWVGSWIICASVQFIYLFIFFFSWNLPVFCALLLSNL